MPSDTVLHFRRLVLLERQWRRHSRMGAILSLVGHLLALLVLRNVAVGPQPHPVQSLGYEGPMHLVDLAPEAEILREQELLAEERLRSGALRSQPIDPGEPSRADSPSLAASEMIFPPVRAVRARPEPPRPEEPIVIVLGEDWSRPAQSSERALSEQFQTLKIVRPGYPPRAIREELEGLVELEVRVDILGRVAGVSVRRSPPLALDLEDAAIQAMRQWEFKPLRKDQRLVPFTVVVPFRFRLVG